MLVGFGVAVGAGVFVGFGVAVGIGVLVGFGVAVGTGVFVSFGVTVGINVLVGFGVGVLVSVASGVTVYSTPFVGCVSTVRDGSIAHADNPINKIHKNIKILFFIILTLSTKILFFICL